MARVRPARRRDLPRPAGALYRSSVRNQVEAPPPTGTVFKGASTSRRALGWNAPTVGANDGVLWSLDLLRARSRAAVRNDGFGKSAIDKLVTNIVGTGIKPLSQARDPEFRKAVQALWLRWTDESDADGLLDFYGQQALAVRAQLEGGEAFPRLRFRRVEDGLSVPLQLQILEPEFCPHTYNDATRRIRAGIEFSAIGQRVRYWMYRQRPGDLSDIDVSQLVPVPADTVLHLYDPLRPGQLRGLPHLTQALVKLRELDDFDDATLLRQKIQNLFAMFVKRAAVPSDGEALNPLDGTTIQTDDDGRALLGLEPGSTQELAPGEDLVFAEPPAAADTYADFMRQQLMGACVAADVPYEVVTGDMRAVNDRTVRVILNEFRRRIQQRQHQIVAFQFCRPVWRAWMDRVFLSGALPIPSEYLINPEPWLAVKWIPQGWPYINPVQDIQAQKDAIRAGLTSRSSAVSEQGEDAEVIDAEQAEDNRRADELGNVYDSDARRTAGTGAAQPRGAGSSSGGGDPEPEPEPTPRETRDQTVEHAIALATKALETVAASLKPVDRYVKRDKYGRVEGVFAVAPERSQDG